MVRAGSVLLHLSRCVVGTEIIAHRFAITGHAKPIVEVARNVTYLLFYSESAAFGTSILG